MTRSPRVALCALVAVVALAAPSLADAQAKSRGSSGGAKSAPPARSAAPVRQAAPVKQAAPAKPASRAPAVQTTRSAPAAKPSAVAIATAREARSGQPATGTAVPRGPRPIERDRFISIPLFTGLGFFSPWYGFGYDPFYGFGFSWLGYGYGYPYGYGSPFGYGSSYGYGSPYGYGYPYGYVTGAYSTGGGRSAAADGRTGSIRLKVKPGTAKVYVDGALVGVVSDFDGLTEHLELAAGAHHLELRADGYQTYQADIQVSVDKTMTERVTLKKK